MLPSACISGLHGNRLSVYCKADGLTSQSQKEVLLKVYFTLFARLLICNFAVSQEIAWKETYGKKNFELHWKLKQTKM